MDNDVLSAYDAVCQSQSPLVLVVEGEMPAAVGGDLLQQTHLVLPVLVQEAFLTSVDRLHVPLQALPLNDRRLPLRSRCQSARDLREWRGTGSSMTSESMRLTSRS